MNELCASFLLEDESQHCSRSRRVLLDSVERDAAHAWPSLKEEYKCDKEFVLAALRKSPTLPPKAEFERRFPQSLRWDRQVVLAFSQRDDFEQLYYSRLLYIPDTCRHDKQVVMNYCRKIPRSLQDAAEELRNDRQVVEAALALDGLELQYAALPLREEKELVRQACLRNARALEFCPPGKTLSELTSNRQFMMQVVQQPQGGPMLKLASKELKHDPELILEALVHNLRFRFVPPEIQASKQFLLQALRRKSSLYMELSRSWQQDADLALAAILAPDSTSEVHARVLKNAPDLKSNRDAVLALAKRAERDFLEELLESRPRFRDDKEIMVEAVTHHATLFEKASDRLKLDPDVILASIHESSAWNTLKTVPWTIQRQHPAITQKAIELCCQRNLKYVPTHVPEDLWTNRNVCQAWIRRGGRILDIFERTLIRDRDMALEVAKHNWTEFPKVGDSFRSDLSFMRDAVEMDGRVLRYAAPEIRVDFHLRVRAVVNHKDALVFLDQAEQQQIQDRVQEMLDLHFSFLHDFLRGIAICKPHVPPAFRSHLPMLDRGVETSQAFKQLIAEYLGVPVGKDLGLLRKALRNLQEPRDPSASSASAAADAANRRLLWEERRLLRGMRLDEHRQRREQRMREMQFRNELAGIRLNEAEPAFPRFEGLFAMMDDDWDELDDMMP